MRKKKAYEYDDLPDLKYRRQRRLRRERRIKWMLAIAAILVIIAIAVLFRHLALKNFGENFKAPLENPTYWFEQTQEVLFLTITPTISQTPTATAPTPCGISSCGRCPSAATASSP